MSPFPGDPWANTEFHIKWKRYAYIQCSWDTKATLSQLGGYKRVINYMKRWDDLQVPCSVNSVAPGPWLTPRSVNIHVCQ